MRNPIFRSPPPKPSPDLQKSAPREVQDNLQALRLRILRGILGVSILMGLVSYLVNLPESLQRAAQPGQQTTLEWVVLGVYTLLLLLLFGIFLDVVFRQSRASGIGSQQDDGKGRRPNRYWVSAAILLLIIFFLGTATLLTEGLYGSGRVVLITLPVIAAILLDRRGGILALAASLIALFAIGFSMIYGFIPAPELAPGSGNASLISWATAFASFTLFALVSAVSLIILLQGLEESLSRQAALSKMLDLERSQLENRIQLRTSDLERRLLQIRTAAEISQQIASRQAVASFGLDSGELSDTFPEAQQPDLPGATGKASSTLRLLAQICELMRQRFNLYYVGIFLLPALLDQDDPRRKEPDDAQSDAAILVAGTGEAGEQMLAEGHQLPFSEDSMIGWSILNRRARIALDVGRDAVRFHNPHLPETRSELALPILFQGKVLGAMSIQSIREAAFDEDEITILQGIADSLGAAIENSRLISETRANLSEIQGLHRQYLQRSWGEVQQSKGILEYRLDKTPAPPLVSANQLADQAETSAASSAPPQGRSIEAPIRLRGQVIGRLTLEDVPARPESGGWSEDELAMIEAVTNQTALALENARLLEETRMSAMQEQLSANITSKVWSTPEIETILQTTLRELGQALQASDGWISLEIKPEKSTLEPAVPGGRP